MATINNIGGTSLNSFSINGGVSFYQGTNKPDNKMGKNGDYYFLSNEDNGDMYFKKDGVWLNLTSSSLPDPKAYPNRMIYSNGNIYDVTDIIYNDNGTVLFPNTIELSKIPNASTDIDSKVIPTIGWINDPNLSTNVVHRTGDEDISGDKTFNDVVRINSDGIYSAVLALENSTITKNETPTELPGRTDKARYWTVCAIDKTKYIHGNHLTNEDISDVNDNKIGQFEVAYYDTKKIETRMESFNPTVNESENDDETNPDHKQTRSAIAVGWDENGDPYTRCNVLPPDTSNNTSIATTQWTRKNYVRNKDNFGEFGNQNVIKSSTTNGKINFPLSFQNSVVEKGKVVSFDPNAIYCAIDFYGKYMRHYSDRLGMIECDYKGTNTNNLSSGTSIYAYNNQYNYSSFLTNGVFDETKYKNTFILTNGYDRISIRYQNGIGFYTDCPPPNTKYTNLSRQIATAKWVNDSCVHLTGNENISGTKTFKSNVYLEKSSPRFRINNTDVVKGSKPKNELICGGLYIYEKSGDNVENYLSGFSSHMLSDGTIWAGIYAYQNVSKSTSAGVIRVYYPMSGKPYTYTNVTPSLSSDNSLYKNQLATVGWVDSKVTPLKTTSGTKTYSGGDRGYWWKDPNTGLIIQWGFKNSWSSSGVTITLPIPFTTTNYSAVITRNHNEWAEAVPMQTSNYKKESFKAIFNDPSCFWIAIGK